MLNDIILNDIAATTTLLFYLWFLQLLVEFKVELFEFLYLWTIEVDGVL